MAFHVVLLAGGSGTRFWPLSRHANPKQLLALSGQRTLLEESWRRARRLAPAERIWVVAPAALARPIRAQLKELGRGRLVLEPSPRDTAPAAVLATSVVAAADSRAVVGLFPTDHVIRRPDAFKRSVRLAAAEARRGRLVCLGVRPDRPATGFGYLACAEPPVDGQAVRARRFVEKPDLARAKRFVQSGRYLWNAGMFVWQAERFLDEARRSAPDIVGGVERHLGGRRTAWGRIRRISIDYAVMEQAREVSVVPLDAGWDDVGSWDAAARLREEAGLGASRDVVCVDSPNSVVFGEGRLVAVVGLPDVVVVDTPDALLVVRRDDSEQVRRVVDELGRRRRRDLL